MLKIQPDTENATSLSHCDIEHNVWLSKPQSSSESICEDTSGKSEQVAGIEECNLHFPPQPSNNNTSKLSPHPDRSANLAQNAPTRTVSDISKHTQEMSSQPVFKDSIALSLESDDEIWRSSENSSTRIIPSEKIVEITKNTLEASSRPVCKGEFSLPMHSEDESSSMSVSLSINPSEEVASISRNPMSLAPTCKDGSSLSLYSDDETASVSERALATIEYASSASSASSESDEDEDKVLSQLPRNLVAQTPQVLVDNSSDVHIGPHFQYSGPITVKQYITLSGGEAIESDSSLPSSKIPAQIPQLKDIVNVALKPQGGNKSDPNISEVLTDVPDMNNKQNFVINTNYSPKVPNNVSHFNNGVKMNGIHISEDTLLSGSEDTLLRTKKMFFKIRYILVCVIIVVVSCIGITLSLVLPSTQHSSEDMNVTAQNINMTCKFKNLRVSIGDKKIQWVVDIQSNIGELMVDWYGPKCKLIEQKDGPSKYEVENIYLGNGKMQTALKVLDVKQSDKGWYMLHVYNDKDEKWDSFTLSVQGGEYVVACYVAEWAHLRVGQGLFTVENIDPTQCTHLLFAFANLNITTNTIYSAEPDYDLGNGKEKGAYEKMTSLRKKHPHLKVLISMGGWAERLNKNYSIVAESPVRRKEFVASVVKFISEHNFDGLDVHWQYPTEQNGKPADKQNFVYLLKELREEFDKQGKNWLLTAPLGVMPDTIEGSYNIPEINKYLHYMFALCYAYHGFWDRRTGPNAPLYRSIAGDELNVQASIQKLLRLGAQPEKLVLGLPLNGRSFLLENEKDVGYGKPTVGDGFIGPYVQETGSWGYNEICYELGQKHSNWVVHWDNVTHTPYMTNKEKFITYDNERSLTDKVDFALSKNLAGVVVYSLDTDDFRGVCAFDRSGITNYPLMRAINNAFYTASYGSKDSCKNTHKEKLVK